MVRYPGHLVVALSCVSVGWFAPSVVAQQVYSLEPPAEVNALLNKLRKRDDRSAVINALAARDDAAPYLRLELRTAADKFHKQDLSEALRAIEARAYERNLARTAWWVKTRRLDLYTEFLSECRDQDATEVADWLGPVSRDILDEAAEQLGRKNRTPMFTFKRFGAFPHLSGNEVTVPLKTRAPALIRAGDCTLEAWDRTNFLVAVRGELSDPLTPEKKRIGSVGQWVNSIALVNTSLPLAWCDDSLIVCAGDIELVGPVNGAVLIASGSIRSGAGHVSTHGTYLCAGGDIALYDRRVGSNYIHAGGSSGFTPYDNVKEKQKALPFGVRFVSPADFGLEIAPRKDGVRVTKIDPDSPFAKYGVKGDDVITKIDDADADSVTTFRHQLRRGILRESVVLRINRGGERISRIVFLDGIPLPAAPPPRQVRR
jgi:hypothetical protein